MASTAPSQFTSPGAAAALASNPSPSSGVPPTGAPAAVSADPPVVRFASRDHNSFALRLLAALRNEFGGHAVREA